MQLSPLQSKLIEQIKKDASLNSYDYAAIIGSTELSVRTTIGQLRKKGILEPFKGVSGSKADQLVFADPGIANRLKKW